MRRVRVIMASPKVGEFTDMPSRSIPAGFEDLYARHYEAVFRAAVRVTGNPSDAEDVLQTVFLRVLSHDDQDEAARRPVAYFRRAAVNAAVDLLRRRAAHGETVYDDLAGADAVESPPLLKEELRRAIATLEIQYEETKSDPIDEEERRRDVLDGAQFVDQ